MENRKALVITAMVLMMAIISCGFPAGSDQTDQTPTVSNTATNTPLPPSTSTPTPTEEPTPSLPVYVDPVIFRFAFFTPTQGWAVTRDGNTLLFTVDGGQTWLNATPSELNTLPPGITSLSIRPFFLDESMVWFTPNTSNGAELYHSSDSGQHWTITSPPFDNARYHFLNLNDGFALVSLGAGAGSHYVALYQTPDAGATWTEVFSHEPMEMKSLREGGSKNGITFLNVDRGWVGGAIPMDDYFYLFVTEDGGATWAQEPDISLPATFTGSILDGWQPFFVDDTVGYLPVRALGSGSVSHLLIYRSNNGGQTWTYQNAIQEGEVVDFTSVNEGWLASSTGLHHTTDGGATWSPVTASGIPAGEYFLNMDFVDSHHGWVLTTPDDFTWDPMRFFHTEDGGETWVQLPP